MRRKPQSLLDDVAYNPKMRKWSQLEEERGYSLQDSAIAWLGFEFSPIRYGAEISKCKSIKSNEYDTAP